MNIIEHCKDELCNEQSLDVDTQIKLLDAFEEALELLNRMHYTPSNPDLVGAVAAFLAKHRSKP